MYIKKKRKNKKNDDYISKFGINSNSKSEEGNI